MEALHHQHETDEDEERKRQDLQRGVVVADCLHKKTCIGFVQINDRA
jgi:transcriptional regulator of NAD metabolism